MGKRLEKFISKYGVEEGNKKYEEFLKKLRTNTKENYIEKFGEELGNKKWSERYSNRNKHNLKNYIEKFGDQGEEKFEEYHQKMAKRNTLEGYIERLGEKKGKEKYEEFCKLSRRSLNAMIEHFGNEEGKKRYEQHKKNTKKGMIGKTHLCNTNHLQNYVDKYGKELGEQKWKERYEKSSKSNTLEGYINRFGQEDGLKKWNEHKNKLSFAVSLDGFISRYGKDEGEKRYQKMIQDRICNEHYSERSQKLFNEIMNKLEIQKNECRFGNDELMIFDKKTNKSYLYDFCYKNKIIEFNGTWYHCDPKIYNENYIHPMNGVAKDIWEKDKIKNKIAKLKGYDVLVIWEKEFENDFEKIVNKCIKFLQ